MTIQVETEAGAQLVIANVMQQLEDWSTFFQLMNETVLPEAQKNVWDRAFGLGLIPSLATMEARRRRWGYYKIQPDVRAYPAGPYLEWTGSLRHATDFFTTIGPKNAVIDPNANYEGPIEGGSAFQSTVGSLVPESNIWFVDDLDRRIDQAIEVWLSDQIVTRVAA